MRILSRVDDAPFHQCTSSARRRGRRILSLEPAPARDIIARLSFADEFAVVAGAAFTLLDYFSSTARMKFRRSCCLIEARVEML